MESEKTLDELLGEPIMHLLMRRDGVEAQEVRGLAETLRRRIAANDGHPLRLTLARSRRGRGHE